MADEALQASEAADAGRSVVRAQDVPAQAASSNQSEHSAEPASAVEPCRQAAVRFAGRSCAAAESSELLVLPEQPRPAAAAVRSVAEELRQPAEAGRSSPRLVLEATVASVASPDEQAVRVPQASSPPALLPEQQASEVEPQPARVDEQSAPGAAWSAA
jgi:hypothetical protein